MAPQTKVHPTGWATYKYCSCHKPGLSHQVWDRCIAPLPSMGPAWTTSHPQNTRSPFMMLVSDQARSVLPTPPHSLSILPPGPGTPSPAASPLPCPPSPVPRRPSHTQPPPRSLQSLRATTGDHGGGWNAGLTCCMSRAQSSQPCRATTILKVGEGSLGTRPGFEHTGTVAGRPANRQGLAPGDAQ